MAKKELDFHQVYEIKTVKLAKRTLYDHDQYYDIKAEVTNGDDFKINVRGSQTINIDTFMGLGCLDALIEDLQLLRAKAGKK